LPLVIVRKRPTLTCFHPTPPGSSSLLQVSINSEEVHEAESGIADYDGLLEQVGTQDWQQGAME
jgi:hypothetical protein